MGELVKYFSDYPMVDWMALAVQMEILGVTPNEVRIFLEQCIPVTDESDFDEWNW